MAQQRVESLLSVEGVAAGTDVASGDVPIDTLKDEVYVLRATKAAGAGALDVKVQDSVDGSAPWFDLVSFTQITDTNQEVKTASRRSLPHKRTVRTIADTAEYDIDVDMVGYYS